MKKIVAAEVDLNQFENDELSTELCARAYPPFHDEFQEIYRLLCLKKEAEAMDAVKKMIQDSLGRIIP